MTTILDGPYGHSRSRRNDRSGSDSAKTTEAEAIRQISLDHASARLARSYVLMFMAEVKRLACT